MVSLFRTLNFQSLHIFIAIIRLGGVSAAADHLGMAKSAVSKHLSQLESLLGVKLVNRTSRRIALTQEGERLIPMIESLLAEGERLIGAAEEQQDSIRGIVRIAGTPEFGSHLARFFFPQVLKALPELKLILKPAYELEDLQNPTFDLAFRIGAIHDERLVVRPLGQLRRILIASPEYIESNPINSLADLSNISCLVFSANQNATHWDLQTVENSKKSVEVPVTGSIAVRSFQTLLSLAEQGQGVAFVPSFVAAESVVRGSIVRVLPQYHSAPAPIYLTYRPGSEKIARLKEVINLAQRLLPPWIAQWQTHSAQSV